MAKWPGLPERLREAFERAGYWKHGRPDVLTFSLERRFVAGYLYKYIAGTAVPDRDNLYRLAEALGVSPAWLLFGDEGSPKPGKKSRKHLHPIAGGSAEEHPYPAPLLEDVLPLIRHWLRRLWGLRRPLTLTWA